MTGVARVCSPPASALPSSALGPTGGVPSSRSACNRQLDPVQDAAQEATWALCLSPAHQRRKALPVAWASRAAPKTWRREGNRS